MQCVNCSVTKLSSEYYLEQLTKRCRHVNNHCAKCLQHHVRNTGKCTCGEPVYQQTTVRMLAEFLLGMSPISPELLFDDFVTADGAADGNAVLHVAMLDGRSFTVGYQATLTVQALRKKLSVHFPGTDPANLRLLYRGKGLSVFDAGKGGICSMQSLGIAAGECLQLVLTLYRIEDGARLDNITFHLNWGYARAPGIDYLDGSCLVYQGREFRGHVDWSRRVDAGGAVNHSGDRIDQPNSRGTHIIKVDLQKLPRNYTHLFFTLSAYGSPTLAVFDDPGVELFETSQPEEPLCNYEISTVNNCQAVIMCWLARVEGSADDSIDNTWRVEAIGRRSAGNATPEGYEMLRDTITQIQTELGVE